MKMKVATILGIPYLHLEQNNDYHLCLSHLLADKDYMKFFREKSRRGYIVICDNGVVETGLPMAWSLLKELAEEVEATELILPDRLNNMSKTLALGEAAIADWNGTPSLFAVPQGKNQQEWRACLIEMLSWPVTTIGISKFVKPFANSRVEVIYGAPELLKSNRDVHILGCLSISDEVANLEKNFPGRIRGIDSGIAAICAQVGIKMSSYAETGGRLDIPLDFFANDLDIDLLTENVNWWRRMCEI